MIELLETKAWQMTFGERAALEGILAQVQPALSVEIGTAEGGSLRRIAAHSTEAHSFDLIEPEAATGTLPNVTLHTGDSHVMLGEFLDELAGGGRNVDFVLIDGDHTAEGVRHDLDALLSSAALTRCVILIHDTANEIVRDGLERVPYDDYPNVWFHDLDFVPGHLSDGGPFHHQLWGGLGLIVVDSGAAADGDPSWFASGFYSSFEIFRAMRDALATAEENGRPTSPQEVLRARTAGDAAELSEKLGGLQATLDTVLSSSSWRGTAPLRKLRQSVRERRHQVR